MDLDLSISNDVVSSKVYSRHGGFGVVGFPFLTGAVPRCAGRANLNREEGNDQESIQLPNTFRSKTPKGKEDAVKATATKSKHYRQNLFVL